MRTIRLISLALIFVLAGFYANKFFWPASPDPQPTPVDNTATPPRDSIPDFTLNDLNGVPRNLSEWSAQPLLINFWATWCAPCRREMPMLETLHRERREDPLTVIGIAIDRLEDVAAFVPESGVTYPILVGQNDGMDLAYEFDPEFTAMPFTVFTAPGGRILTLFTGEMHPPQLREILAVVDAVASQRISVDEGRRRLAAL